MKQWSGWAHTLRTKESRRKPDKSILKINENEYENENENENDDDNENKKIDVIDSVGEDKKDIENNKNEEKIELELKQDSKRMKKEGDVIDKNKTEMKEEKVEENNVMENIKNENIDDEGEKLKLVEEKVNENENEIDEDKDNDEHAPPKDQYNINRPTNITYASMAETGKKVKRILDQGRVKFLQNLGLRASQIKYCHPSLSPECIMIVADRQI